MSRTPAALLKAAVVLVVLRVLAVVLGNYPDYFPPNFDSLFLEGREPTFYGHYQVAFTVHILTAPLVLVSGLVLLSDTARRRAPQLHRHLGRVHAVVLLTLMLPSGLIMARQSYAGWPAGLSFALLSVVTAAATVRAVQHARRRDTRRHRTWARRSAVLLASAVTLRLTSGTISLFAVGDPESAYVIAAWASWVVPLGAYELWRGCQRRGQGRP